MNRLTLLSLQILVAVVSLALWHVLSTVPIGGVILLPPFFFSTPGDVARRVIKWFEPSCWSLDPRCIFGGTIWKHLWITLVEAMLAFVIGSVGGVLIGFWFARKPMVNGVFGPYVKSLNALRAAGR